MSRRLEIAMAGILALKPAADLGEANSTEHCASADVLLDFGRMEAAEDVSTASLPLNSAARIPVVGLGVWQTPSGAATREAVASALRFGYRHVDTARIYGNEADV